MNFRFWPTLIQLSKIILAILYGYAYLHNLPSRQPNYLYQFQTTTFFQAKPYKTPTPHSCLIHLTTMNHPLNTNLSKNWHNSYLFACASSFWSISSPTLGISCTIWLTTTKFYLSFFSSMLTILQIWITSLMGLDMLTICSYHKYSLLGNKKEILQKEVH